MKFRFFSDTNQRLYEDYLDQRGLEYVTEGYVVETAPDADAADYARDLGGLETD